MKLCSVLITGSNRGIGLELVKQILAQPQPPEKIFATSRDPESPQSQELKNLAEKHSNLVVVPLEATDSTSIKAAAQEVEKQLKGAGLNILINNAGIMGASPLETVDTEELLRVYTTNLVGPLLVAKAFLPLLKKAAQGSPTEELSCSKAALINISTLLGSIERAPETFHAQVISYRCSKAALNMLTRCQAQEYKADGILCTAIHPGWVQTDLGGPEAPLTVDISAQGILKVLSSLSEKHNGILVDWEGNTIPW